MEKQYLQGFRGFAGAGDNSQTGRTNTQLQPPVRQDPVELVQMPDGRWVPSPQAYTPAGAWECEPEAKESIGWSLLAGTGEVLAGLLIGGGIVVVAVLAGSLIILGGAAQLVGEASAGVGGGLWRACGMAWRGTGGRPRPRNDQAGAAGGGRPGGTVNNVNINVNIKN